MITASALTIYAEHAKYPEPFGWFTLATSLALYLAPRKIHLGFSVKSADILKPLYFQLTSHLGFIFGGLIIYHTHLTAQISSA
jgi:hypothetical protein